MFVDIGPIMASWRMEDLDTEEVIRWGVDASSTLDVGLRTAFDRFVRRYQ